MSDQSMKDKLSKLAQESAQAMGEVAEKAKDAVGAAVGAVEDAAKTVLENTGFVADQPAVPVLAPTLEVGDSFWYLHDGEDLEQVTAERKNPALGIENILFVGSRSAAQVAANILGRVTLTTNIATIQNITIFWTRHDDGQYSIRLNAPSYQRKGKEGEAADAKKTYVSDVRFTQAVKAQILRYVDTLIKENQAIRAQQAAQ